MATRIALTLAGGVSLGAYQGGAAYELLWALSHLTNPRERIIIDVVTGASAGSMTAAVMARALLFDRQAASALHQAWVTGVSFAGLLEGRTTASLLSSDLIWGLAEDVLKTPSLPYAPHPAAPHELRMAFTLSNLDGVRYGLGYANVPGRFDTTVFSDWIVFRLGPGAPAQAPLGSLWDSMKRAAIASGAFPLAFPPVGVERQLADYAGSDVFQPDGRRTFAYADGGLFNNEPVGLTRQIVEGLEETYPEIRLDDRLYILVDPYVSAASAESALPDPLTYQIVLGRLVGAILGESSKRDWIRAMRVNQRLEWQDLFLSHLAGIVATTSVTDGVALGQRVGQLALDIAALKVKHEGRGESPESHLSRNMARLGPMLVAPDPAYAAIRSDPLRTEVFLNIVYVMENVAGLRKKEHLDLNLIAPAPGSLAGDFLGNFGGFFDEAWREHDWRRGRASVRDFVDQVKVKHPEMDYVPDDPAAYIPARDLSRVSERDIPLEAEHALREGMKTRLAAIVSPANAGWLKRWGFQILSHFVANKLVDHILKREAGGEGPIVPDPSGGGHDR
jgi:hypothetical protein